MISHILTQKTSGSSLRRRAGTTPKTSSGLVLLSLAALAGGSPQTATAATFSWVNAKITNWSDTTAWSGGVAPTSNLDNVISFTTTQNSTGTNDLGPIQLNRLVAENSGTKSLSIAAGTGSNNLNFVRNSLGTLPTLQLTKGSTGALNISIPITVTDALTITNSGTQNGAAISGAIANNGGITFDGTGTGSVTLGSGVISGAGGITLNGSYTLTMSGNNTYDGLTDVQAGTLTLNRSGGTIKNTSAVRVSGGTLNVAQSDTVGAVTLSSGTISGAGTLTGASYALTNTGTVSAVLGGSGALTKTGAGTATLSGANSYSGGTTVSEGTLSVSGSIAGTATVSSGATLALTGSGTAGAVTVNSGTFQLGTAGTAGAVTINGGTFGGAGTVNSLAFTGASTFGPGNSPGTVTIANGGTFALSSGTTSTFQFTDGAFGAGTFDLVTTSGSATGSIDGTLNLEFTGTGYTAGTSVTFIDLTSISGTFSTINVTGLDSGLVASVSYDNAAGNVTLNLALASIPEPSTYAALCGAITLGLVAMRRSRPARG